MIRLPLGPEDAGLQLFFNKPATDEIKNKPAADEINLWMKLRRSKRGEICTALWSLHAATVIICTQFKNSGQNHFFL